MSQIIRTAFAERSLREIESDINGILALQSQNIYANLSPTELDGGFVTTPFTPDLLRQLIVQTGVFIAEDDGKIVGYLLAGDWNFFSQWEIFRVMISHLPKLNFQGQEITIDNSFQYGPVCIDRTLRGGEILPHLFAKMSMSFAPKFPIGITFINKLNQRSFAAHTRKLNLEIVDEFELNGNSFYTLAFFTNQLL
jgi:hypothetical protein